MIAVAPALRRSAWLGPRERGSGRVGRGVARVYQRRVVSPHADGHLVFWDTRGGVEWVRVFRGGSGRFDRFAKNNPAADYIEVDTPLA